jgi:hypothetical protein
MDTFNALCRKILGCYPKIVYEGAEGDGVALILEGAKHWLARKHERKLVYSEPVLHKRSGAVEDYFAALRAALDAREGGRKAFIMGLGKPWDHWTVAREVGARDATFFDSWGFPDDRKTKARFDEFTFDKNAPGVADYDVALIDPRRGFLLTLA